MIRYFIVILALMLAAKAAYAQPLMHPPGQQVVIETRLGSITIELMPTSAPLAVDNFLRYVRTRYYIGRIFYRVMPGFVAQAGSFDTKFKARRTFKPIPNESERSAKNLQGTVSMTSVRGPENLTANFSFNLRDNPVLDYQEVRLGAPVFARVVDGMEVVQAISDQPTGRHTGDFSNAPNDHVVILDMKLVSSSSDTASP